MAEEMTSFHPLLPLFKERMRIFHKEEDDNLTRMLESSVRAIGRLTGSEDYERSDVREMVLERTRYAYNDQVEFFYENFKSDLLGMALDQMKEETEDDQGKRGLL